METEGEKGEERKEVMDEARNKGTNIYFQQFLIIILLIPHLS